MVIDTALIDELFFHDGSPPLNFSDFLHHSMKLKRAGK